MAAQPKAKPRITPLATITGFVNLLKPDTKYNPDGDFKVKVIVPKADIGDLLEAIEAAAAESRKEFLKQPDAKAKLKGKPLKSADLPWYEDENGDIVLSFKSKASYVNKEGSRVARVVPIFGKDNRRIAPDAIPQFGAGSTVKVAFFINGFCNVALGSGASLRIDSVKLIEAQAFSGGGNPFGDDEGDSDVPGQRSEEEAFGGAEDDQIDF